MSHPLYAEAREAKLAAESGAQLPPVAGIADSDLSKPARVRQLAANMDIVGKAVAGGLALDYSAIDTDKPNKQVAMFIGSEHNSKLPFYEATFPAEGAADQSIMLVVKNSADKELLRVSASSVSEITSHIIRHIAEYKENGFTTARLDKLQGGEHAPQARTWATDKREGFASLADKPKDCGLPDH